LGIADVGIESSHEDLTGKVYGDPSGHDPNHGTHVAGIAAARSNNGLGISGVDWNAQIFAQYKGYDIPEIVTAINNCVTAGCRVINNSWGMQEYSQEVYDVFYNAYQAGVVLVVANPTDYAPGEYPNSFGPWILNVAATTNLDVKARYSLSREYTDIGAPGGSGTGNVLADIYSTVPPSSYGW